MKRKILIAAGVLSGIVLLWALWLLDIPNWVELDRQLLENPQSASVAYDRNGNEAFSLFGTQKRRMVRLADLPEYVPQAFIAAEDQRFYQHCGIDIRRIAGAALNNIRRGGLTEGASTITQQLIKLTHLSSEKTFRRKIQEARLAMEAERIYTKDEILEAYLNVIYFGGGAYGIDMAAEVYFGKTASELTLDEAAMLAGIIKSPNNYSPRNSVEKAIDRRNYVLKQMKACGYIDSETYQAAARSSVQLSEAQPAGISGWYRDAVVNEAMEILGISADDLLDGGYEIYTALDVEMQRQADICMQDPKAFPADDVEGAMIAVDPLDGGVLALCGGRNNDVRMALNRALDGRRQPGSIIKPISVYAAAIDSGRYLPSDIIEDRQQVYSGGYMPRNASDRYYGEVSLRTALSRSLNAAAVSLANEMGVPAMRNYARRFGIPVDSDDAGLSLALGSMTYGVTPAQVAGAYAALANGGHAVDVHLIERIDDRFGKELYRRSAKKERVVSEDTAAMLTDMLVTAASQGSARALADVKIPIAGKTGTVSEENGTRDVWVAAYTPEVCVAVWMGYDSSDDGVMPESASGSGAPARMAAAWFKGIADGLEGKEFNLPDGLVKVNIDRVLLEEDHLVALADDLIPADECMMEIFPENREPVQVSTRYAPPRTDIAAQIFTNALGQPVISFTPVQDHMEYMILRHQAGEVQCVHSGDGIPGEPVKFTDTDASLLSGAEYQIVIRRKDMYGRGTLLSDTADTILRYEPLMSRFAEDVPENKQHTDGLDALFRP